MMNKALNKDVEETILLILVIYSIPFLIVLGKAWIKIVKRYERALVPIMLTEKPTRKK